VRGRVFGKHSGRAGLRAALASRGHHPSESELLDLLAELKRSRQPGGLDDDDLESLYLKNCAALGAKEKAS
jgi:isopropylmalate/homocitrate/citramalate synthase